MNEHDVVRVKETVMVTPNYEDDPIEIKAGWEGTIVAQADTHTPCIEFNEVYLKNAAHIIIAETKAEGGSIPMEELSGLPIRPVDNSHSV